MSALPVDRCGEAAVYALGSLEPAEAHAFEHHLVDCTICRDELATFEEVTRVLPMAAPQYAAAPRLRRRVLADVRASAAVTSIVRRRIRWSLPRPAVALGAAAALGCGVTAVSLALTAGPSIHTRVLDAQVLGTSGSAKLRLADGHAELILHGMPQPPAGRIYEVWLQQPGRVPQPTTALFSVTAGGDGDVDVPGSLRGVTRILVTREPAGGSRTPTTSPTVVATLS